MTKPEFIQGFSLLTVQPWGKPYRGNTPEATIQAELYYKHVDKANPVAWQAICEAAAQGDHWPSLSDIKSALQARGGYEQAGQRKLTHSPVYEECPEEVKEKLRKLGVQL